MLYLTLKRRSVGHKRIMRKLEHKNLMCKPDLPFEEFMLGNARKC